MFEINEIIKACGGKLIQGNLSDKLETISTDSRELNPKEAFLALKGDNFDGHDFIAAALRQGAACLIVERAPGCPVPKETAVIKVKNTVLALGDIARFQRKKFKSPVIAVTGSNGKTTTKEMLAWVLSGGFRVLKNEGTKNNQIGLPQTLIRLSDKDDFASVELGTNHFGEIDYLAKIARPNIGVITNIGLSHIEFFKNLNGVLKEKSSLLDNLAKPGAAFLCADDKLLKRIIARKNNDFRVFTYGIDSPSDFRASSISVCNGVLEFKVNSKFDFALSTLGYYNIYNALAVVSVSRILGFSYPEIASRLAVFKFPRGRLNLVEFKGLTFIDDTYNSNPLSLGAALKALGGAECKGRKILVMGDMLELGEQKELLHERAAESITDTCDVLVTVGNLSRITAQAAKDTGFRRADIFSCDDVLEAKDLLFNKISPEKNDIILVKGSRSMKMEGIFKD